jgi:DNA-binding transcriptional LysR family regulator
MDFVNQLLAIELPLFPKLRVQLESGFSPFLAQAVLNGSMDLAIAIGLPEIRGLVQVELRRDQCYVAVPLNHPALGRDQIFLRDLDENNWALFAESVHPWLYDSVLSIIREEGLSPSGLQHITTPNEGIALVEDQDWISFMVHGSLIHFRQREIALRPLADSKLSLTTNLIMRTENTSKLANSFARSYIRRIQESPLQREFTWNEPRSKAS